MTKTEKHLNLIYDCRSVESTKKRMPRIFKFWFGAEYRMGFRGELKGGRGKDNERP